MKSAMMTLACLLLYFATAGAQSEAPLVWDELRSEEGNFIAWLPGKPVRKTVTSETKLGPIDIQQFSLELPQGLAFIASYSEMPIVNNVEKQLEGARDGAVSKVGGTLLSDRKVTLSRYPGRAFRVQKDSFVIEQRVFLVGKRLYQINAAAIKAKQHDPSIRKFLDSFKLLDESKAP